MTVFFQGAELQDFPVKVGNVSHSTNAGSYNASNARCSINVAGAAEGTNYLETSTYSSAELWFHALVNFGSTTPFNLNFLKWYSGGAERLALRFSQSSPARLEIRKLDGTYSSLGVSGDVTIGAAQSFKLDILVKLGNPGSVRVYLDNIPVIANDAANLTWSGVSVLDKMRLGNIDTSMSSGAVRWSEIIVADWNTINSKLVTRIPNANGTYSEWSGAGYTALNELTPAATYMTSGTADQRVSVGLTSFPALAGGERIERVQVAANALRDASGPQKENIFYRVAGADNHRSDRTLTVSAADYTEAWDMSPATSTYWTPTELNASEPGMRSRA
ncbi:hypothetical protein [Pseudaminobacter soli (ex Li et al. 2025)]|uniref:Uncharacterized protein n=1 Tax=Pseudaminobacter soli (ex Li et al. 2025) TaxID=1295366 RepID=A0A2P7SE28_9HYPH|nr:hypothetical protein [Mesorhizobium soli]PSJ60738.1 hypothetical protein C7I85_11895 [Mesorhizobium soli]